MSPAARDTFGCRAFHLIIAFVTLALPMEISSSLTTSNSSNSFEHPKVSLKTSKLIRGKCTTKQLLVYLAMFCIAIYFVVIFVIGSIWEYYYEQWQPNSSISSKQVVVGNSTANVVLACVIEQHDHDGADLEPKQLQLIRQLKRLARVNYLLAFDSFSRYIIVCMTWCTVWSLILTFTLSYSRPICLSSLSFMFDSQAERRRLKQDLARLAWRSSRWPDFGEQVEQTLATCRHSNRLVLPSQSRTIVVAKWRQPKVTSASKQQANSLPQPSPLVAATSVRRLAKRQTRLDFRRQLANEQAQWDIVPLCVSEGNLKGYYNTALLASVGYLVVGIVASCIVVTKMLQNQVETSLAEQVAQLQCKQLLHSDSARLEKHRLNNEDDKFWQDHWRHHEQDESGLFWLEFKRLWLASLDAWLFYLSGFGVVVVFYAASVVVVVVYVCNLHYKLVWLADLDAKMDYLYTLMSKEACRRTKKTIEKIATSTRTAVAIVNDTNNDDESTGVSAILGAFASCYLSYEQFREQHQASRWVSDRMASFCLLGYGVVLVLTYSVYDSAMSDNLAYNLYTSGLCVIAVNAIWASSALIVRRVERFFGKLMRCQAMAADLKLELSYVVILWRRQLLDKQDFGSHYALSLFGVRLSQSALISLDSELIGLALVIYGQFYQQH